MNLQRIQYYLKLCETLHFTDAARQLSISQPALTKAIVQLENELGTRLIRREGKHTHLTRHGESARKKYTDLMQLVSSVETEVKNLVNGEDEKLRFAVAQSLDFSLLAEFIASFHKRRPNIYLEVLDCSVRESEELLLQGEVDCVFTNDCEAIYQRVVCIELYEDNLVIAGSENAKYVDSASLEKQVNLPGDGEPVSHATQIFNKFSDNGCVAQCSQQLWAQQLVKAGLGFSVLPVKGDRINGVVLSVENVVIQKQTIYAAIPAGRKDSKAFSLFVSMLKNHDWV